MPTTRDPIDLVIRNFFLLQRAGNTLGSQAEGILDDLFREILAVVAKNDPTAVRALRYRRDRVEAIMEAVNRLSGDSYRQLERTLRGGLVNVGVQQSETGRAILQASIGQAATVRAQSLGADFMRSVIRTNPFDGATLSQWAASQRATTLFQVRRELQRGLLEEETLDQIVGRLTGRASPGGAASVARTAKRHAESLARTAINEVSSASLWETYRKNTAVTKGYKIVATLDSRTTPECRALDGQEFPYEDDSPRPPFHWGCRTTLVAVIDWKGLGLNDDVESTRAARDLESGRSEQVDGTLDYEGWLRGKSATKQREILGAGRYDLFREGLTLRDMVVRENGVFRQLTLDELRAAS